MRWRAQGWPEVLCSRSLARPRRLRRSPTPSRSGTAPFGVAADALTGAVYVANTGSNTVSVISDQTNMVTDTIDVGSGQIVVAADAG